MTSTLRAAAARLCSELDALAEQLKKGDTPFGTCEGQYSNHLQPLAYGLAKAMLNRVPDWDPRITTNVRQGEYRSITSVDLGLIEADLSEPVAIRHIKDVCDAITALSRYLS